MKEIEQAMLKVVHGDITQQRVDIIVNAANTSLLGGGGVDGAIHRAGGKEILDECVKIRNTKGGCNVGEAVITTAGKLQAKYVIHTVGPVWNGGANGEEVLLRSCYRSSLLLAVENNAKSIAFPNISTGIYRYPKDKAALVAIDEIKKYILGNPKCTLEQILFVCFDPDNTRLYKDILSSYEG